MLILKNVEQGRIPLQVADKIAKIVKGKRFCDLECSMGDMLALMEPHAKSVVGSSVAGHNEAEMAIHRGFEIHVGYKNQDVETENPPEADFYYVKCEYPPSKIIKSTLDFFEEKNIKGDFIFAYSLPKDYNDYEEDTREHYMKVIEEYNLKSFEEVSYVDWKEDGQSGSWAVILDKRQK